MGALRDEWFVEVDGKRTGPYAIQEILGHYADGDIDARTRITCSKWRSTSPNAHEGFLWLSMAEVATKFALPPESEPEPKLEFTARDEQEAAAPTLTATEPSPVAVIAEAIEATTVATPAEIPTSPTTSFSPASPPAAEELRPVVTPVTQPVPAPSSRFGGAAQALPIRPGAQALERTGRVALPEDATTSLFDTLQLARARRRRSSAAGTAAANRAVANAVNNDGERRHGGARVPPQAWFIGIIGVALGGLVLSLTRFMAGTPELTRSAEQSPPPRATTAATPPRSGDGRGTASVVGSVPRPEPVAMPPPRIHSPPPPLPPEPTFADEPDHRDEPEIDRDIASASDEPPQPGDLQAPSDISAAFQGQIPGVQFNPDNPPALSPPAEGASGGDGVNPPPSGT